MRPYSGYQFLTILALLISPAWLYGNSPRTQLVDQNLNQMAGALAVGSQTALTSYTDSLGHHVIYVDQYRRVNDLYLTPGAGQQSWRVQTLTNPITYPVPLGPLTSPSNGTTGWLFFLDQSGHVQELYNSGSESSWQVFDVTATTGAPGASNISNITSYVDVEGYPHIIYEIDTGSNWPPTALVELVKFRICIYGCYTGWTWSYIGFGGFPPIDGSALSSLSTAGTQYLFFEPGLTLGEYYRTSSTSWTYQITNGWGEICATLSSYSLGSSPHVLCNSLLDVYSSGPNGPWTSVYLPGAASSGGAITSNGVGGDQYVFYADANRHVHELYNIASSTWYGGDWTAASGGPAISGGITSYFDSGWPYVFYVGADSQIHELYLTVIPCPPRQPCP
jgi:hypothetical protein